MHLKKYNDPINVQHPDSIHGSQKISEHDPNSSSQDIGSYFLQISEYSILTHEQMCALYEEYKQGSEKALEQMITGNLRLVVRIARDFERFADTLDLIQEGTLGLRHAIAKDPEKGTYRWDPKKGRFSTYATLWIRQHIIRWIQKNGRTIRVPTHRYVTNLRIKKVAKLLRQELRREPKLEEIAQAMNTSSHRLMAVLQSLSVEHSLEDFRGDDDESIFDGTKYAQDGNQPTPEAMALANEAMQIMSKEINMLFHRIIKNYDLGKKYVHVLAHNFGLIDNFERHTLEETGEIIGVTRERIRQITTGRSMKRLAHIWKPKKNLEAWLEDKRWRLSELTHTTHTDGALIRHIIFEGIDTSISDAKKTKRKRSRK